jgi:hypothetical protein
MMPADLRRRLREEAAQPTRPLDVDAVYLSGLRRRRRRHAGLALLALSIVALVGLGAIAWMLPPGDVLELAESPREPAAQHTGIIHRGALPDGTRFAIHGATEREEVTGIHAVINVDLGDGAPSPLGVTTFVPAAEEPSTSPSVPVWDEDVLRLSAGAWRVQIEVADGVLSRMGPEARVRIADSISAAARERMPVLTLEPPLSFADDAEVPASMEVMYETFTVRRGCDDTDEATCSDDGCVQVLLLADLVAPTPPTPDGALTVTGVCPAD